MRARSWLRIGQASAFLVALSALSVRAAAQPAPAPGQPRPPAAPGQPNQPPPPNPQPTPAQPAPVPPAQVPPTQPGAQPTLPAPGEGQAEPQPATPPEEAAKPTEAPQPAPEPAPAATGSMNLAPPELHPVPAEPPDAASAHWYDALQFRLFADAYLSINYNFPKPQADANSVVRAYDTSNGFALSWVGADVSYPAEPVGGALSLRFGPTADRLARSCLAGPCDSDLGLAPVKQAFASWKPGGADSAVRLDFGKFDTIYGAEVAESQDNINYTRGLLYWFAQPAFHTGLRLNADIGEAFTLKALVVNGYNNTVDNNLGKTFGLQGTVNLKRGDEALGSIALGYLVGPERDDTKLVTCAPGQVFDDTSPTGCVSRPATAEDSSSGVVDRVSSDTQGLRHLIDLVVLLTPVEKLTLVLNGDFGIERVRDTSDESLFVGKSFYGVMAGARYGIGDKFGIAGRGEYLSDHDDLLLGFEPGNEVKVVSGTLTLDFLPADYLLVRLDNRLDWSNREIFPKSVRDASGTIVTTTLGVVVKTN